MLGSYHIHQTHSIGILKASIDPLCSVFESDDDDNINEEVDVTTFDPSQITVSPLYPPDKSYTPSNNSATFPTPPPPTPTQKVSLCGLRTYVTPKREHVPIVTQCLSTISDSRIWSTTPTVHVGVTLTEPPPALLKVRIEVEGGMEGKLTKIFIVGKKKVQFICKQSRYPYGVVEANRGDVKLPWQWKMKQAYHHFVIFVKRIFRAAVAQIL